MLPSTTKKITPSNGLELLAAKMDLLFFALHPNRKTVPMPASKGLAGTAIREFSSSLKKTAHGERTSTPHLTSLSLSSLKTSPTIAAPSVASSRPTPSVTQSQRPSPSDVQSQLANMLAGRKKTSSLPIASPATTTSSAHIPKSRQSQLSAEGKQMLKQQQKE